MENVDIKGKYLQDLYDYNMSLFEENLALDKKVLELEKEILELKDKNKVLEQSVKDTYETSQEIIADLKEEKELLKETLD
jgi:hypothetical protein